MFSKEVAAAVHMGESKQEVHTVAVLVKDVGEAEVILDKVVVEGLEAEGLESRPKLPVHRHVIVAIQTVAVTAGRRCDENMQNRKRGWKGV